MTSATPRDDVQDIIDRFSSLPSSSSSSASPPAAASSLPLTAASKSEPSHSTPSAATPSPSLNLLSFLKTNLSLASLPTPRRAQRVHSTSDAATAVPPSQIPARLPSPSPTQLPSGMRLDPSVSPSHFISALLAGRTAVTAASPQRLQGASGDLSTVAAASPALSTPGASPLPHRSERGALHALLLSTTRHSLAQLRSPRSKRSPQSSPDVASSSAGSARAKRSRSTTRSSSTAGRHHRQLFTRAASTASALLPPSSSSAAATSAPPVRSSSTSSPARQRAAKEVQRAQLKAAAEAAKRAATAARLLIKLDPAEEQREEKKATTPQPKRRKRQKRGEPNGEEVRDVGAEELLRLSGVEGKKRQQRKGQRKAEGEESKAEGVVDSNATQRKSRATSAGGGGDEAIAASSRRARKRKEGTEAVNGFAKKRKLPQRGTEPTPVNAVSVIYATDTSDGVGDTSDDSADASHQRFDAAVDDSQSEGTTGAEEEEEEEEEDEEEADDETTRLRSPKPSSSSPFGARLSNPLRSSSLLGPSSLSSASFIAPSSTSRSSLTHRTLSAVPRLGRLGSGQDQSAVVSLLTGGK